MVVFRLWLTADSFSITEASSKCQRAAETPGRDVYYRLINEVVCPSRPSSLVVFSTGRLPRCRSAPQGLVGTLPFPEWLPDLCCLFSQHGTSLNDGASSTDVAASEGSATPREVTFC